MSEAQPSGQQPDRRGLEPADERFDQRIHLDPDPQHDPALDNMSGAALRGIYTRLGRVEKPGRARRWELGMEICWATCVAGVLALVPLAATTPRDDLLLVVAIYLSVLLVIGVAGLLCRKACKDVTAERVESLASIRTDLGALLKSYGVDLPDEDSSP